LLLLLTASTWLGCSPAVSSEAEETGISKDRFISAYVELRVAALNAPDQELTLEARNQVLAQEGVEEGDLLEFIEVHGRDVPYMRRLWEEVDSILEELRRPDEDPDLGDARDPGE
jgi:hypothetical protein